MDLAPLQALTDARARPSVFFLFGNEPIDRAPVLTLHDELAGRSFDEVDLIIHSAGGSVDAAYQAMTLLRLHAEKIHACVPFWAKGEATLLCIGADTITLGEQAELGPLDVQVYEEKQEGRGEYRSALDPLKELEQLESLSLGALASAMRFIATNYGMSSDDSLRHAMAFVEVTTGSLVARLDPEVIGRYGRELAVATDYAERLLSSWSRWPPRKISEVVDQLVYGYPSHDYVIDHDELRTMGFDVGRFPEHQLAAVGALLHSVEEIEGNVVRLLEPSPASSVVTVSAIAGGARGTTPATEEPGGPPTGIRDQVEASPGDVEERVGETPPGADGRVATTTGVPRDEGAARRLGAPEREQEGPPSAVRGREERASSAPGGVERVPPGVERREGVPAGVEGREEGTLSRVKWRVGTRSARGERVGTPSAPVESERPLTPGERGGTPSAQGELARTQAGAGGVDTQAGEHVGAAAKEPAGES